jgi:uncharacterized membrane protein YhaH (DUF805 family)
VRRLFSSQSISRREYLLAGLLLFAIKYPLDALVASSFDQPWGPFSYLSPRVSPLLKIQEHAYMWLSLMGVALPFLIVGVLLTLRRLRNAGMHPAWALAFFLPFLNIPFFLLLAFTPSASDDRSPQPDAAAGPFRTVDPNAPSPPEHALPPAPFLLRVMPRSLSGAWLFGMGLSLAFQTACAAVGIALSSYGLMLFLVAPVAAGAIVGFCVAYRRVGLKKSPTRYGLGAGLIGLMLLLAMGIEGILCVALAAPFLLPLSALGGKIGGAIANAGRRVPQALKAFAFLPLLIAIEGPPQEPPEHVVETVVHVAATPETVFHHVVSFPPLGDPPAGLFDLGLPRPLAATIDGQGEAAIRRCHFTSGTFVEPIEVWRPGEELTFGVSEEPRQHSDYLTVTRGQFRMERSADGTTRLIGRTWYRLKLGPAAYWRPLAEWGLHTIHGHVLAHVKRLAESSH